MDLEAAARRYSELEVKLAAITAEHSALKEKHYKQGGELQQTVKLA
jgi:hypothetical protein